MRKNSAVILKLLLTIYIAIVAVPLRTFAQDNNSQRQKNETAIEMQAPVEVHLQEDPEASYLEKRSVWAFRISPAWEKLYPNNYVSPSDGKNYAQVFDTNQMQMISIALGGQRSTVLGALYVDLVYGAGAVPGVAGTAALTMQKKGISFGLMLNSIFNNPWVIPFIGGEAVYFSWKETDTNIDISGMTAITTALKGGLSIPLNKIDEQAAHESYIGYGLKNTYLDVYAIMYNTSNSANDPDFKTAPNIGASFRLEF